MTLIHERGTEIIPPGNCNCVKKKFKKVLTRILSCFTVSPNKKHMFFEYAERGFTRIKDLLGSLWV